MRWTGQVQAPVAGTYRFSTVSDDGIRLWVNGQQVINNWTDHAATTNTSAAIALTAGVKYTITLEFYEKRGRRDGEAAVVLSGTGDADHPAVAAVPVITQAGVERMTTQAVAALVTVTRDWRMGAAASRRHRTTTRRGAITARVHGTFQDAGGRPRRAERRHDHRPLRGAERHA